MVSKLVDDKTKEIENKFGHPDNTMSWDEWVTLAQYVLAENIRGKIEILEEILTGPDWGTTAKIKSFQQQLQEIENEG